MSMILFPIRLTAATARRTAVAPELSPKPLQPCEVRNLVLKPLFIALLTIREAERLRYLCFNFKTNDRGELIYKRVSCDLGNAIRDLEKELKGGMFGAELQLMQFLEYRFFEDTKKVFSLLREKSVAAQVNEVNKRKRATLEACIDAAIRELKSISVAQADKFRCCGVCANYRYEVAAKGRCKWPSYNASQMRPACKRFERVNENLR